MSVMSVMLRGGAASGIRNSVVTFLASSSDIVFWQPARKRAQSMAPITRDRFMALPSMRPSAPPARPPCTVTYALDDPLGLHRQSPTRLNAAQKNGSLYRGL